MPLLEVQRLSRRFGGLAAVKELTFEVEARELQENDHVRRAYLGG